MQSAAGRMLRAQFSYDRSTQKVKRDTPGH